MPLRLEDSEGEADGRVGTVAGAFGVLDGVVARVDSGQVVVAGVVGEGLVGHLVSPDPDQVVDGVGVLLLVDLQWGYAVFGEGDQDVSDVAVDTGDGDG